MTNISNELVEKLASEKKFETIQEFASIAHMGQKPVIIREYTGTAIRAFEQDGNINILYPEKATPVQESALAKALTSGTIFDDAEEASRGAAYIRLTIIPGKAFAKSNPCDLPRAMGTLTKACVGQMDDDGRLPCSPTCIENGHNFEKDMILAKANGTDTNDVIRHHLDISDEDRLPSFMAKQAMEIKKELDKLREIEDGGSLDPTDYTEIDPHAVAEDSKEAEEEIKALEEGEKEKDIEEEIDKSFEDVYDGDDDESDEDDEDDEEDDDDEVTEKKRSAKDADDEDDDEDEDDEDEDDDEDEVVEEAFVSKRPKKLKDLKARETVSYITVEMHTIRDSNDQAMLSAYTCSKLELCDFYINCLDTQDARYVVPHNRAYLVQFQTDLNRLLTQILAIKPVSKQDRIWQVGVNYPDWRI